MKNFLNFIQALLLFVLISIASISSKADWSKNFGGKYGGDVIYNSVATDVSGNTYFVGYFTIDTFTIGAVSLNRIGNQDAVVAKLDSSGTVVWAKNFGGSSANVTGRSVEVDSSGNVFVAGDFFNADLTTPTLSKIGSNDAFAFKLDSSGNTTWAKNFGGSGATVTGAGIAVDSSGNVSLGGYFGGANLTTPAITKIGSYDAYVVQVDSNGNTNWSKNFGGASAQVSAWSIASDISGNIYLAGYFQAGSLTTPSVTKIGAQDAFVFKLDSSGNSVWSKNFGGASAYVYGYGVTTDSAQNVYITGYFSSANLTTPAVTRIGGFDAFAFKLDSSGATTWSKNYGGTGSGAVGKSIKVDASGNVYVGGILNTASLTTPALTIIGGQDSFALKLNSSGTTIWAKNFGGSTTYVYCNSIANDPSGNVYLVGYFNTSSLTTPALTKVGYQDTYVIKLDSSGNSSWSIGYGGLKSTGVLTLRSVAKDSQGNIYLGGSFNSLKNYFGSTTLTLIGVQDAFAAKLDPEGNVLWAKNFGGTNPVTMAYGNGIAVDTSGNVYLGGYFKFADLTTPALTKIGTEDAFAIKLDSSGNTLWARNYGGSGAKANAFSIASDTSGNVYLGGNLTNANLTTPALTKLGTRDAFALKINSSGTLVWSKNYGGAGANVFGQSITFDASGNVYLGGYFSGANLTTPALTKIGTNDGLAIKLDSSGTTTWAKNFGGSGASATSGGIAVDISGNVYFSSYFSGASLTTPALSIIGTSDILAIKLDSSGTTTWAKNFGGSGASATSGGIAVDINGKVYVGGYFNGGNLTTPALTLTGTNSPFAIKMDESGSVIFSKSYGDSGISATASTFAIDGFGNILLGGGLTGGNLSSPATTIIGTIDALLIDVQLYNVACTATGKVKFDSSNNVLVFCDGAFWQSMNNNTASTCNGSTNGKFNYYANGASSDLVWYAGSCRSAKSSTTFGACGSNGKLEWDSGNSVMRGCINGTWTSLKGR